LGIRKLGRNDIKWSNILGDRATHFDGYTKSPNADNSSYNRKNAQTTFDVGLAICVSFAKERKTHVGWATVVG
jgi:hypothetical protein